MRKTLVIGYGNPGRLDDGLGPLLAEKLEAMEIPGLTVDSDYQLTVEDAAPVAEHDVVIFADAHVSCDPPFSFTRLEPDPAGVVSFSTHHAEPEAVLALAKEAFGKTPDAFALGIRGYEFNEFGERISDEARRNLDAALEFLVPRLQNQIILREEEV